MQLALVIGRVTSTVKHESLAGRKLLIARLLGDQGQAVADPVLILDDHGAGAGDRVMITSDSLGLCQLLGFKNSPARWWTLGIVD